jgi:FSR family fosmidomycin resistance protein-like MFS transporter
MSERGAEQPFTKAMYLALGHFVIDLYAAFLPPLLPLLIDKFQISFTSASLLAAVLTFSASMTQPVFGFLFDKLGGWKMIIWGPVVAGLSLSFLGLASHYSVLILLLILGGLGLASFHPEAAALTTSLSGQRRTWGMSIFMLGGNLGYSLGPFLILIVVINLGLEWSFFASLPALGTAWVLHRYALLGEKAPKIHSTPNVKIESSLNQRVLGFSVLFSVVVLRVTTVLSLVTFLPMVQKLRGFSLIAAGGSMTVFMACGAFGGLIGGYLADRVGRRRMILASFLLALPALSAFLYWKGPMGLFILALLGFLLYISEPSCIVLAQEMVPHQARTASGLIMGMAWGLGGGGVLGVGALADVFGIEWALRFLLLLPAGSLILSFFLPSEIENKP